jgi:hypothetical protein
MVKKKDMLFFKGKKAFKNKVKMSSLSEKDSFS